MSARASVVHVGACSVFGIRPANTHTPTLLFLATFNKQNHDYYC